MASARDATNTRWVVCLFAGIVHAEALQQPVKAEVLFKEVLRAALRPLRAFAQSSTPSGHGRRDAT